MPIRLEGVPRTPTPVPRTKPPSAPPGKRRSQELAAAAPPAGAAPATPGDAAGVATVHDVQGKIHIDAAAAASLGLVNRVVDNEALQRETAVLAAASPMARA